MITKSEVKTAPLGEIVWQAATAAEKWWLLNEVRDRMTKDPTLKDRMTQLEQSQVAEAAVVHHLGPWPMVKGMTPVDAARAILDSAWDYQHPRMKNDPDAVEDFLKMIVRRNREEDQMSDGELGFHNSIIHYYSETRKEVK